MRGVLRTAFYAQHWSVSIRIPRILTQASLLVCSGNSLIPYKMRTLVNVAHWLSTLAWTSLESWVWWTELGLHSGILKLNQLVWQDDCSLRQFVWFLSPQYFSGGNSEWLHSGAACPASKVRLKTPLLRPMILKMWSPEKQHHHCLGIW